MTRTCNCAIFKIYIYFSLFSSRGLVADTLKKIYMQGMHMSSETQGYMFNLAMI